MAAPLLQLAEIALTFGGNPLFDDLSVVVQPGERLALVGRNGSGKSTLMKIMAGLAEADSGQRMTPNGISVGYLPQDPDMSGFSTLGDYASAGLPEGEDWRVAAAGEGLGLKLDAPVATASGGERRRAALARLLAGQPDLMLLDEPTNHLDIAAILWLETYLKDTNAAFILISHDRAFLRGLTTGTLWLDRGQMRRHDKGFSDFEAWRDKVWEDEDQARHKMDQKLKAEGRWAVEGISARRKRNQGRLRALYAMREERGAMIRRQGAAALDLAEAPVAGKLVIDALGVAKTYDGRALFTDFTFRVFRGDRVALVGPNGTGKTTLLKVLTGELAPDTGTVKLGTNLQIARLDQNRSALDPTMTLWDALTADPALRLPGRSDQVMVRGEPRHVVGYLKDFLFTEGQSRAKVSSLSGGEKARLMLARIMAQEANLLVLDEPTNDLDVETLDLLQELLADYQGTVILVSHDRDFLDRVATVTIAMEGDGRPMAYPGGWSDYQSQRGERTSAPETQKPGPKRDNSPAPATAAKSALSFTEKHRLAELPDVIAKLEGEIAKLTAFLGTPDLFTKDPAKAKKASEGLAERQTALEAAMGEWMALEEKASA
jgi:ABC transport system ATP-binding/permease protein